MGHVQGAVSSQLELKSWFELENGEGQEAV